MIKEAWKGSSNSYRSDRWRNFDEVVSRLSFPEGAYWYLVDNIKFAFDSGPGSWSTAEELFNKKFGDCEDDATFITYCLLHNGYYYDEFETHETNAAASLILVV